MSAGLREAMQTVLDTFRRDESQGYHSRDRQFAIDVLAAALDGQGDAAALPDAQQRLDRAGSLIKHVHRVEVAVAPEEGGWVALCKQYDHAAQGRTREEAVRAFRWGFVADVLLHSDPRVAQTEECPADVWTELVSRAGAEVVLFGFVELTAAGDAAPRVAASQWQPIETAPKGTMLLFCSMTATEARHWCFVDWHVFGRLTLHPQLEATHWMPLPSPPATSGSGDEARADKEKDDTGLPR